jgi:hypothetical protein
MKRIQAIRDVALTFLLVPVAVFAQLDDSASLKIRFPEGKTQFHVGELIPIELSLSSSAPDAFDMDTRSYDRSGRLNLEHFHVTPAGRDPMRNYYSNGVFMGGGLGGSVVLSDTPQLLREDLNEWVALDQPEHYTLSVTTERVSRRSATRNQPVELQSNTLEIDVVAADPSWLQQAFHSAETTLSNPSSSTSEKAAALRSLRFLDSAASILELVHQLGSSENRCWDCVAGLAGSRHQDLVVRELEQQLEAPDFAVTSDYLFILTKLKFQLEHGLLPPYPKDDEKEQAAWSERMRKQGEELSALENELYRQTATVVPMKRGQARAKTIRTLLVRPAHESADISPLAVLSENDVAMAFISLSPQEQYDLLSIFWERVNVPTMVAPLSEIARQPQMKNEQLRDLAMQRLYQLNATAGTPILLEEIQHPHVDGDQFTVKGETLGVLPDKTLPQFDQLLATRLQQKDSKTLDLDAQLVGRYATKAILPSVKTTYTAAQGTWNCVTEDGFVLYFLRVDADYGIKRLAEAPSYCMVKSLKAAIRMKRWSEIEPAIIAGLNNPDLNRARQAAETLAKYGGPKAEAAMWKRLKIFHDQWADRESGFSPRMNQPRDVSDASSFQYGLVQAIGQAQGWVLTDEQITQLESLTLGQERDNVKPWHWNPPLRMSLNVLFDGQLQVDINHQYFFSDVDALREKLAQYPGGTQFQVTAFGKHEQLASVVQAVREAAADHGLDIELAP